MKQSRLETIPGVGPKIANDLHDLGFQSIKDLRGQNPDDLYSMLMMRRGCYIDRCVLYVFRCAVYYAENGRDHEKLRWWYWKDTVKPNSKRIRNSGVNTGKNH